MHEPLPWFPEQDFEVPLQYVGGVWVALVCALFFMAFYAFRVAEEARQLADALAATELVLQREQHLSALDGLAAAAAHELGTPLATIALVAHELAQRAAPGRSARRGHPADPRPVGALPRHPLQDRLALLRAGGASRAACRCHISWRMRSRRIAISASPSRSQRDGEGPEPVADRNPGLLYGLGNLVDNAVDFAKSEVRIAAEWTPEVVRISIADDGPGFSPDVIDQLGEPYVTTRRAGPPAAVEQGNVEHGGLGLGIFIAKTLLERSGAQAKAR